jgi:hypothetical protein
MKNSIILIFLLIKSFNSISQVVVDKKLVDHLIQSEISESKNFLGHAYVLKFHNNSNCINGFYFSWTFAIYKEDIPNDILGAYIYSNQIFLIRNIDVKFENGFKSEILKFNSQIYNKIVDSAFKGSKSGDIITTALPLPVYKLIQSKFNRKKFHVLLKCYIPYSSAPKEFWPIDKFAYSYVDIDQVDYLQYKDKNGKYNDTYYEQIRPKKFTIFVQEK